MPKAVRQIVKGVLVYTALLVLYSAGGTVLGSLLSFPRSGASFDPKAILPVFMGAIGTAMLMLITDPSIAGSVKKVS